MKFCTIPVEADAIQFNGNNYDECLEFCPILYRVEYMVGYLYLPCHGNVQNGVFQLSFSDWIVKDNNGNFYAYSDKHFKKNFKEATT